jgi:hypothetical protein
MIALDSAWPISNGALAASIGRMVGASAVSRPLDPSANARTWSGAPCISGTTRPFRAGEEGPRGPAEYETCAAKNGTGSQRACLEL